MKRFKYVLPFLLLGAVLLALALPQGPAGAAADTGALFINVGKADAALLVLGEKRYLVDTGSKDSYDQLERALTACGVECLGRRYHHPHGQGSCGRPEKAAQKRYRRKCRLCGRALQRALPGGESRI